MEGLTSPSSRCLNPLLLDPTLDHSRAHGPSVPEYLSAPAVTVAESKTKFGAF